MKSITKIIIGLVGIAAIGLLTYYVVTKEKNIAVIEKPVTNPDKDTVATAKVIQDTIIDRIKKEFSIDGEEFTLTDDEGVYINSTKDKMLVIKEDIWKEILRKIQKKLPNKAKDCYRKYEIPSLSEYTFVGLLTYYAESTNTNVTIAYTAVEIRNGKAKSFAGGNICCGCKGEPLVPQQVDAVIVE
jgi:6-pyruvoyl-tetrahydropterin synthase